VSIDESEGDINVSAERVAWQERHLSEDTRRLLEEDARYFMRQASPRTISDEAHLLLSNTTRYVPNWKTVHIIICMFRRRTVFLRGYTNCDRGRCFGIGRARRRSGSIGSRSMRLMNRGRWTARGNDLWSCWRIQCGFGRRAMCLLGRF